MDARDIALQAACPVVIAPRFGGLPEMNPGQRLVVAANGLFVQVKLDWLDCIHCLTPQGLGVPLPYGDVAERLGFSFGVLPIRLIEQFVAAARRSLPNEAAPAGVTLWSDDEQARFQLAAQEGLTRLQQELTSAGYEVDDESCTAPVIHPSCPLLRVRVFMPAANSVEANDNDKALLAALAAFAPHPIEAPESYWKVPGWYEHYFELKPADQATFDAVVALTEGDWEVSRDVECDAVWNPTPGHVFLLPGVIWANILLFYPNPPAPDQEYLPL